MYQDTCGKFIPQTLTSNLKAEFTVLANQWRTLGGGGGLGGPSPPPPPIILKDCKNLVPNDTNYTRIM